MSSPVDERLIDRGASAVEYGLLIAGIAVVIISVVFMFGSKVDGMFSNNCDSIASAVDGTACAHP